MLHMQGIKNLDEIKELFAVETKGAETILDVCERFFISTVTRRFDTLKRQVVRCDLYLNRTWGRCTHKAREGSAQIVNPASVKFSRGITRGFQVGERNHRQRTWDKVS